MRIENEIIVDIAECVKDSFSINELDVFTSRHGSKLGGKFKDYNEGGKKIDQINSYLDWLNRGGKALSFFFLCWNIKNGEGSGFKMLPMAQEIYEKLNHIEPDPIKGWSFAKHLFYGAYVLDNQVPFINRTKFRNKVYELIHRKRKWCLCVNGESGAGKTWTKHFFNEIYQRTNAFELIIIDFKKDFRGVNGQIDVHHIANYLVKRISLFKFPFDFSNPEHFKLDEFWNSFMDFLENSTKPYLFFFDQFDRPYTQNVTYFIDDLVNYLINPPKRNYNLVLSGYPDIMDWDEEYQMLSEHIRLDPFSKSDVEEFIDQLYPLLKEKDGLGIEKKEFLDLCSNHSPFWSDHLYQPNFPNVRPIYKHVTDWLQSMEELLIAN